ncbi:MAG: NADH:flavin oxidoreductase [Dehalococcoidia bacterium]|nr:NADH:flavin oxidoreductase [Dehalococcoidia bacterium]
MTTPVVGSENSALNDAMHQPLQLNNFTVKNRIFRSNISGQFDHYDGSGSNVRINWEEKFAREGIGAIISSFVPISRQGRIVPNYAMIDDDDKIPFWEELGQAVHRHDCRYILQLSHSGRQRDIPDIQYPKGLSSTGKNEPLHGFECTRMTKSDIDRVVEQFAQGALRAKKAGLDGVELHGANGYLINQFLSSGINDRKDECGGSLENRARFVREIARAIRREVGDDFHLQMKISGTDYNNAVFPWEGRGNSLDESIKVCQWLEQDGVNAFHVSSGSMFPHPRNPPGGLPMDVLRNTYAGMAASGRHTVRNFLLFRMWPTGPFFSWWWRHRGGPIIQGISLDDARLIKRAVSVPVISTGGYQSASVVNRALEDGDCDAISIARSLLANPDLLKIWEGGADQPERPCTYCNKCLVNGTMNPIGCYELSRFDSPKQMIEGIYSIFHPREYP